MTGGPLGAPGPRADALTLTPLQEALSVYKEAVQKMPPQFAPHSLFNMMGKSAPAPLTSNPRLLKFPHVRFCFKMSICVLKRRN